MKTKNIELNEGAIETFCKKWKVGEFSLFGSVLRDDFNADSDIDVLISFFDDTGISLFELGEMKEELEAIFGRSVDLIEKEGLQNPYRRERILSSREIVYASE